MWGLCTKGDHANLHIHTHTHMHLFHQPGNSPVSCHCGLWVARQRGLSLWSPISVAVLSVAEVMGQSCRRNFWATRLKVCDTSDIRVNKKHHQPPEEHERSVFSSQPAAQTELLICYLSFLLVRPQFPGNGCASGHRCIIGRQQHSVTVS